MNGEHDDAGLLAIIAKPIVTAALMVLPDAAESIDDVRSVDVGVQDGTRARLYFQRFQQQGETKRWIWSLFKAEAIE